MSRPGFIAQVGLDFGTAFSKCVVRDLGSGNARVLNNSEGGEQLPLFASVLGLRDGALLRDSNRAAVQLRFAKMVLTDLARGRFRATAHPVWKEYLEDNCHASHLDSAIDVVAWMLAPILVRARMLAAEMMPGFGKQQDDYLFVNLCVPVEHLDETRVQSAFRSAIEKAWSLSRLTKLPEKITPSELRDFIRRHTTPGASGMCFLYPEVAANVQAFLRSGFAKGYWGVPFLMSDVGSGTVDQSFFILSPDHGKLTFLAALVEAIGSSEIEKQCASAFTRNAGSYEQVLERFRAHKEGSRELTSAVDRREFSGAVAVVRDEVRRMTCRCGVAGTRTQNGNDKLRDEQFRSTMVMFAGGGVRPDPYNLGVQEAFSRQFQMPNRNLIDLPRPSDLLRADGRSLPVTWFRRLTVAYGLSFSKAELHEITLPSQVQALPPRSHKQSKRPKSGGTAYRTTLLNIRGCRDCGRPAIPGDDRCYSCSN